MILRDNTVLVRLTDSEKEGLQVYSDRKNLKMSEVVRLALREYIGDME